MTEKFKYCFANTGAIWEGPIHGKYLGDYERHLTGMTVSKCKQACLQMRNFHCRSFSYDDGADICYLSSHTRC